MSMFDLKKTINESLYNIKEVLESDYKDKQKSIDTIVYNTIETLKESNEKYKNNAIEDFIIEAKRLVLFTNYEINY
jgi:hypothetical protein